jgi:DNA damage-binding protein 1
VRLLTSSKGSLVTVEQSEKADLEPEELFFTSSGRIGVIVNVRNEDVSIHLSGLQRNMSTIVPSTGGTSHARYVYLYVHRAKHWSYLMFTRFRAPKSTRGRTDADQASFGFLDGDFIEQLLSHLHSQDTLTQIWNGSSEPERLSVSVAETRRLLEDLQSYH